MEDNLTLTPLRALMAQCVASAWATPAQADAIASCVEVGYDGCPEEIAAALAPLMGHDANGNPVGADTSDDLHLGRYCVDGHETADAESALQADGEFPPFYVFDAERQDSNPFRFPTRAEAEEWMRSAKDPMLAPPDAPKEDADPVPRWKREFPSFGDDLGIALPPGWGDVSRSDGACPSFVFPVQEGDDEMEYRLLVDFVSAGRRERPGPRFRLTLLEADTGSCLRDVYETDDARAMAAFCALVALRDEVLDWQASLGGEREGLDELCSACDDVIDMARQP